MEENSKEYSDKEKIRREITRGKYGAIFTTSSFPDLTANYATKLLSAFERDGLLVRISKGVYLKAKKTRFGVSYPSLEEIVSQIAKRDKAKICPTGETAANLIGLSEQVTMKTCFLTSGTARELNIDGRTVILKRAAPKNFAYNNEVVGVLVQALRSIGAENITDVMKARIPAILADVETDRDFAADLKLAPAWIEKLILEQIRR
ncbi:MAG: DUF6088 family protein [Candidatus Cryptobacteroides sp.]